MTLTSVAQTVAPPLGHTFVCYARHDEVFVFDVARALHERGVRLWIDQWHIAAGDDWSRAIDAALAGCQTVMIVLSPEAVASDEVRGELRVALDSGKRIIPLLYRPCDVPARLRLKQILDFTRFSENRHELLDRLAHELGGDRTHRLIIFTPEQERRTRRTLLEDADSEARDRLRFLEPERAIQLQLEEQPHHVGHLWDDDGIPPLARRRLPPVANVLDVFDRETVAGRLLILGGPGSGKTTVLLQLLHVLVDRALADARQPIPVLVGLASWKNEKPFAEWLVEQLTIKYGVRADYGTRWRDQRQFALLLDGLDEVAAEFQQSCVEAINDVQRAYRPPRLVVCCRLAEYENFAVKLQLRSAVVVLPLDDEQIRHYVEGAGRPEFWDALRADSDLIEMARSPLLLSFMTALPSDSHAQRWPDAPPSARRARLLDTYLNWRLSSTSTPRAYSRDDTRRWLQHLAAILQRHRLSGFLLERMQPDWLSSPLQQWCFRGGVLVCAAAVAALAFELLGLGFELIGPGAIGLRLRGSALKSLTDAGNSFDRTMKLLVAGSIGAVIASRRKIWPIETLTWSWPRARTNMQQWAATAAWTALDYCLGLGAVISVLSYFLLFANAGGAGTIQQSGNATAAIAGVLAATFIASVRPSAWLKAPARPALSPRVVAVLAVAALQFALSVCSTAIADNGLSVMNILTSLGSSIALILIVGMSRLAAGRVVWFLQAMLIGAIGGAIVAAASRLAVVSVPILPWTAAWTSGGAVLGFITCLIRCVIQWFRPRALSDREPAIDLSFRWWARTIVTAVAAGLLLAAAAIVLGRLAGHEVLRGTALFLVHLDSIVQVLIVFALFAGVSMGIAGTMTAALLAGLVGVLSGATGADIERRLVPNQGIHHSARNVVVFAALGMLIVGVPYGVLNVGAGALAMQTLPTAADWLRLAVAPGMMFGVLAGLLPGAAVIQHFVLRVVLWSSGAVPLRYARFLNFATERRLLQRVGGRYRFIHVLLRDHLGTAAR